MDNKQEVNILHQTVLPQIMKDTTNRFHFTWFKVQFTNKALKISVLLPLGGIVELVHKNFFTTW